MEINEKIETGVIFRHGRIIPKWFVWDNRKYSINKVNYVWNDREGREEIMRFAVSDKTNTYEISYNLSLLNWKLQKID